MRTVWKHSSQGRLTGQQSGVSLIEVMVSVLVLAVALLGIGAMQATALRNGQSSLERSQIVAFSYSILDSMRANRAAALNGEYNLAAMECSIPTGTSLAQTDLARWITSLKRAMLGAGVDPASDTTTCAQVACAAGVCTITVQWDDTRGRATNASATGAERVEGGAQRQVQTVTTL